jgi:uncharacterized membrane protein
MWDHRELSTREYRTMRKTVEDRITTLRRKTIVRPTVEVLAGLVGADARTAWDRLAASGEVERLNAMLRFLFAAVIIDESGRYSSSSGGWSLMNSLMIITGLTPLQALVIGFCLSEQLTAAVAVLACTGVEVVDFRWMRAS